MRTLVRSVVVAAAAAGLLFASGGTANAVPLHQHCMLTPSGYVPIGGGVTDHAPHDPAFHNLHFNVHVGEPGAQHEIIAVAPGAPCP